jgi:Na+-transporting NADH:ubiquinone oxidoreductase subunit F
VQLVIAREYGFDSWRQILLEVSRLRDGGEPIEPEGSGLAQTWAPDGSPVQFECAVQSNHNVATFIKELVLTLPDGVVLSEILDSVRVLIPPHQMQYAEIEVDDEYRAEWFKYDLFAHRSTSTQPQSGTFHLANSPAENAMLKCTVRIASPPPGSNHPPGAVSSYVFSLKPGDKVLVTGLLGRSPVKESNAEMVFLGGGAAMGPKTTQKISYWYGARNLQELYYADDLDALEKAHDNFS